MRNKFICSFRKFFSKFDNKLFTEKTMPIVDRISNHMNYIFSIILFLYFILLAGLLFSAICNISEAFKAAIKTYNIWQLIGFTTTIEFAIIAMFPICTALRPNYYAIIDIKKILEKHHCLQNTYIIIVLLILGFILTALDYIVNFSKIYNAWSILIRCLILSLVIFSIFKAIYLLFTILSIFLGNYKKTLSCLHNEIYVEHREVTPNFVLENKGNIAYTIRQLFSFIKEDKQMTEKFEAQLIHNFSFAENFYKLPKMLQVDIMLKSAEIVLLLIFAFLLLIIMIFQNSVNHNILSVILIIATSSTLVIIGIIFTIPKSRKLFIKISLTEYGFVFTNSGGREKYFSKYKHNFWCNAYGKKEQQYVCKMYNIVTLFIDALAADMKLALYILKITWREAETSNTGYLVHYICLELYKKHYYEINRKSTDKGLPGEAAPEYTATIKHNVVVFINDIEKNIGKEKDEENSVETDTDKNIQ